MFRVLLVVLGIFAAILFPFITIAAINLLFGTAIPYTVYTWLAMFWLQLCIGFRAK